MHHFAIGMIYKAVIDEIKFVFGIFSLLNKKYKKFLVLNENDVYIFIVYFKVSILEYFAYQNLSLILTSMQANNDGCIVNIFRVFNGSLHTQLEIILRRIKFSIIATSKNKTFIINKNDVCEIFHIQPLAGCLILKNCESIKLNYIALWLPMCILRA